MAVQVNSLKITAPTLLSYTPLPAAISISADFGTWLQTINDLITYNNSSQVNFSIQSSLTVGGTARFNRLVVPVGANKWAT